MCCSGSESCSMEPRQDAEVVTSVSARKAVRYLGPLQSGGWGAKSVRSGVCADARTPRGAHDPPRKRTRRIPPEAESKPSGPVNLRAGTFACTAPILRS